MTRTFTIDPGQKPSSQQLREVQEAKKRPIVPDEDAPELSESMMKAFRCAAVQRNRKKNA